MWTSSFPLFKLLLMIEASERTISQDVLRHTHFSLVGYLVAYKTSYIILRSFSDATIIDKPLRWQIWEDEGGRRHHIEIHCELLLMHFVLTELGHSCPLILWIETTHIESY